MRVFVQRHVRQAAEGVVVGFVDRGPFDGGSVCIMHCWKTNLLSQTDLSPYLIFGGDEVSEPFADSRKTGIGSYV